MTRPVVAYVAIAFALGILVAEYMPLWIAATTSGILIVASKVFCQKRHRVVLVIVAGAFFIGAWRYQVGRVVAPDDVSRYIGSVDAMIGTIASDPELRGDRLRFILSVNTARFPKGWRQASGRVMVSVYPSKRSYNPRAIADQLEYGNHVKIETRPYLPIEPTNPGRFSWKGYLARNGIYSCAYVRDVSKIRLFNSRWPPNHEGEGEVGGSGGNLAVRLALLAKHRLIASIERLIPGDEGAVIAGMVLGSYAYLPPDTFRNFSRAGTLHLLAASGFNCWVLVFLLSPLLKLVRIYPRWRGAAVIVFILGYILMVGAKPSLVRAAIMASLMLIARPLKRVPSTISLFFVAAIIVLAINPADLFDIGFQLSFLAVWAIIYVSPIIGAKSVLNWAGIVNRGPQVPCGTTRFALRKLSSVLGATVIVTTAVSLVTAPLVAYYFNYVSIVSVPANMVVGLGVPIIFGTGFAAPIGAYMGLLGEVVGWIGSWTASAMLAVVNSLGSMRWSAASVDSPGLLAIVGYYVILHAVLGWVRSRGVAR